MYARLVGAGFAHSEVLYNFTLFDVELAFESLQWQHLGLRQALRFNTAMTIAPFSKSTITPDELYSLPDDEVKTVATRDGIERAKERVRRFNKMKR